MGSVSPEKPDPRKMLDDLAKYISNMTNIPPEYPRNCVLFKTFEKCLEPGFSRCHVEDVYYEETRDVMGLYYNGKVVILYWTRGNVREYVACNGKGVCVHFTLPRRPGPRKLDLEFVEVS